MNTKQKGDLAEANVIVKLMEIGFIPSKPQTESCRYDIIADDGKNLHKIQVKTGREKNNCVIFNTSDSRPNRTSNKRKTYSKDEIDCFIVYLPEKEDFYWVPVEETPNTEMRLRLREVDSPYSNYENSNWAKEYLI